MKKFIFKILIFLACFNTLEVIAATNTERNISNLFNIDGSPKKGSINGIEFISGKEGSLLILALFDSESISSKAGDNYWYLTCNSHKDEYNMNSVVCGAQREEFTILLTSVGYAIQMENKPRGGGRYAVAFDKEPSFETTYRIIGRTEVKEFLAKMIVSKKMQYAFKNEKNKYVSKEMSIPNTGLVISLLKDIREYY